jgi:hypothetical protein
LMLYISLNVQKLLDDVCVFSKFAVHV